MKILKIAGLIVLGLIALIAIIPAFTAKEYAVKREITINKPKSEVFSYLKLLKNQDNFSVWAKQDPSMKKEYKGTDGTVGFTSSWDSKRDEVGAGEQEIKGIKEGERIDYELRFKRPFEATDYAYIITDSLPDGQTKVTWGFYGKMDYPMNGFLLLMDMDKMMGEQLQTGLNNLKTIQEK